MEIRIAEPVYTDRLASFLESLGQTAITCGPGQIDLIVADTEPERTSALSEIEIYLRVWRVLYPDAEIEIVDDEPPAVVPAAARTRRAGAAAAR
jgi:hypothetical protein